MPQDIRPLLGVHRHATHGADHPWRRQGDLVPVLGKSAPRLLFRLRLSAILDPIYRDWTAVAMGAFDKPTGTHLKKHIFVADKGDYYDVADGLPQNEH
jgi:hypothetical protein